MRYFRRPDVWTERDEEEARVTRLASYNGRIAQGIVHTPEYVEHMRQEQHWFDTEFGNRVSRRVFFGKS